MNPAGSSTTFPRRGALLLAALLPLLASGAARPPATVRHAGDHAFGESTVLVVPVSGAALEVAGELRLGGELELLFATTPRPGVYRIYQSTTPVRGRFAAVSAADSFASARLVREADGRWHGALDGHVLRFAEQDGELLVNPLSLPDAP